MTSAGPASAGPASEGPASEVTTQYPERLHVPASLHASSALHSVVSGPPQFSYWQHGSPFALQQKFGVEPLLEAPDPSTGTLPVTTCPPLHAATTTEPPARTISRHRVSQLIAADRSTCRARAQPSPWPARTPPGVPDRAIPRRYRQRLRTDRDHPPLAASQ